MPFSAQVVAGVGIACAAAGFIIACFLALWFRRWLLKDLPKPQESVETYPQPIVPERETIEERNARELYECIQFLDKVQALEPPHTQGCSGWQLSKDMNLMELAVDSFLFHYTGTDLGPKNQPDYAKLRELAGGDHEDWQSIPTLEVNPLKKLLKRIVLRALSIRMTEDGDCSITLLPPDILSVYQRMLTKLPPEPTGIFKRSKCDQDDRLHAARVIRKYWRLFTVDWSSETYTRLQEASTETELARPGAIATLRVPHCVMRDDDPRMPNIHAVEALILDALEPFWEKSVFQDVSQYGTEEAARADARFHLRNATTNAAEIALKCFSERPECEFFWPATNIREDPRPFDWGGNLISFGVRRSGCTAQKLRYKSKYNEALEAKDMHVVREPSYDDDHVIRLYILREITDVRDGLEERRKARENGQLEETEDERREWEEKERVMNACSHIFAKHPKSFSRS